MINSNNFFYWASLFRRSLNKHQKQITRLFNWRFIVTRLKQPEELILTNALITLQAATDNQPALEAYGITTAIINEFSAKITQAQTIEKEEEKMAELNQITSQKNTKLKDCTNWGEQLKLRVDLAFGKKSPEAKVFVTSKFTSAKRSENQMMNTLPALLELAQNKSDTLAGYGQTPEFIQTGEDLLQSLIKIDQIQEQTKAEKRSLSKERHSLFNQLYETINKINKVGQMVFAADSAKLELFRSNWPKRKKTTPAESES